MAVRLGSNISSIQAQRRLAEASSTLGKTYERLSSGQRINRASDDAAGLSIANALNAGRRVYNQGVRNLNDGISLLQIADSAVSNLSQIVTRIRELAEQSASATFSATQRQAIDNEAQALRKEYFRISRSAEFNGTNLFDGSLSSGLRLQAGFGLEGSIQSTLGRGLGTGGFSVEATFGTEMGVRGKSTGTALGDLNGDGILDLITAGYTYDGSLWQGQANVFLGRGDGSFGDKASYATETGDLTAATFAVTVGDVNGDGILDMVTAGYSYDDRMQAQASVFLGRGDGTFGPSTSYATQTGEYGASTSVALGDVNGDGILDLVTTGYAENDGNMRQGQVAVLLGTGNGTFTNAISYAVERGYDFSKSKALALGDVNGDGTLDLVTAGYTSDGINKYGRATVLLGRGDGSFEPGAGYTTDGDVDPVNGAVALGDINGDGVLDLVCAGHSHDNALPEGEVSVLIGRGDGTFFDSVTYSTGTGASSMSNALALGDVNGDGILDLITTGYSGDLGDYQGQVVTLLGCGDGTFDSRATYAITQTGANGVNGYAVALGDLDGDGIIDILAAGINGLQGSASVLIGNAREGISPLLPFSLKTQADALQAMAPLDRKLAELAAQRGVIGAFQSRLGAASGTLSSTAENYAAAESRIRDTDVATDAAELMRLQISQKAATAILAQANQAPALAVQLLGTRPRTP